MDIAGKETGNEGGASENKRQMKGETMGGSPETKRETKGGARETNRETKREAKGEHGK